jgi:hypothetical protein
MSDSDILATLPEQHLHDLRAVYDMGNLRLQPGSDAADRPWSVLRLLPDPHSGSATAIGVAQNIDTGQLVEAGTGKPIPPGSPTNPGLIEEGSWNLISRIGAPPGKQSGRYKWTEPIDYRDRKPEPDDIYRPFAAGGIVLCRHNPKAEGLTQFNSVSLLPPGWESDVQSAFKTLQKNEVLSGKPASKADISSLRTLASDPNPIVSSIAFRSLAEIGNLDSKTLRKSLSETANYRRAVFLYIALINSAVTDSLPIEAALTLAVQGASQAAADRATVLASTAATLFHPELPDTKALSSRLLSGIRNRLTPAVAARKSDPYVDQLLKLT